MTAFKPEAASETELSWLTIVGRRRPDATVGSPDLRNVRALRMTFTGVAQTTEFEFAQLEVVGSTWLERGVVAEDGTPIAGPESCTTSP